MEPLLTEKPREIVVPELHPVPLPKPSPAVLAAMASAVSAPPLALEPVGRRRFLGPLAWGLSALIHIGLAVPLLLPGTAQEAPAQAVEVEIMPAPEPLLEQAPPAITEQAVPPEAAPSPPLEEAAPPPPDTVAAVLPPSRCSPPRQPYQRPSCRLHPRNCQRRRRSQCPSLRLQPPHRLRRHSRPAPYSARRLLRPGGHRWPSRCRCSHMPRPWPRCLQRQTRFLPVRRRPPRAHLPFRPPSSGKSMPRCAACSATLPALARAGLKAWLR